ncbi:hypothetical protein CEXT_376511 [Caerostris extrusa]|uniref:Uncharacterized protein n=1 Tax=Caerostris extrusa TaxID=172846 RepID=A0AAV4MF15_CAEEX|nr:hypothetical protein CEXT_376511 [Caerostris extrusa]
MTVTRDDNDMITIHELVKNICPRTPGSKMLRKEIVVCIQNWIKRKILTFKVKLQKRVNGVMTGRRNVIFGIRESEEATCS